MPPKKASIKEVARLAGVSTSTVSHVINATRFVSEETRHKVLESVEILKYRPNIMAQGIKGRKSKTIGLIVSHLSGAFFYRLVNAVCSFMQDREYDVLVCDSGENTANEYRHIDTLLRKGIDGLIYAPVDHRLQYEELNSPPIPFVQIERKNEHYRSDYVGIDDLAEAKRVTSLLIEQGCRRIGFLRHGTENYTGFRHEGYMQTCSAAGIYDPQWVQNIPVHGADKDNRIEEWLRRVLPMDGLICTNADLCYLVLRFLDRQSRDIYRGLSLFSFEASKWFSLLPFPLLALDQPIERIGQTAAAVLLRRISGDTSETGNHLLDCGLIKYEKQNKESV